jgi:hypothetical protein
VDSRLLTYSNFVDLERNTLMSLRNRLALHDLFSQAASDASKCLANDNRCCFAFATHWDVDYPLANCRLFVGAIIRRESNRDKILSMSHYMCVGEGRESVKRLLRKFHFDYVTEGEHRSSRHPRFHLQYGGKLPPAMQACGVQDKHIEPLLPSVEGPRIFFWPMTIALLMNTVFYEFPTIETNEIRKTSEWVSLVRENERAVLVPFYELCSQFAGKDAFVFSEKIYVN